MPGSAILCPGDLVRMGTQLLPQRVVETIDRESEGRQRY
jgi:hypothetical protein